jgi:hypothetical protein
MVSNRDLNLEPKKQFVFDCKIPFKVFTKFGTNFGHFFMNGSCQNETNRHFVLKKALFSALIPPYANFE